MRGHPQSAGCQAHVETVVVTLIYQITMELIDT